MMSDRRRKEDGGFYGAFLHQNLMIRSKAESDFDRRISVTFVNKIKGDLIGCGYSLRPKIEGFD